MSFEYPKFYSFPPFFTLQPAAETRAQQLDLWRDLIVSYSAHHKLAEIVVASATNSSLFHNAKLGRTLDQRAIVEVLDYVCMTGNGAWISEDKSIFAMSIIKTADIANSIYKWADKYGLLEGISTLAEIASGSESRGESFHKLPDAVIHNALLELEQNRRVILLPGDTLQELGVKFLSASH